MKKMKRNSERGAKRARRAIIQLIILSILFAAVWFLSTARPSVMEASVLL